ncbi:Trypsin-like serine protease [Vibrio sp. B1FLJ16]|nr:Trypsin-like serine protease [Vibrio sp. B1FLJ16]CAE6948081.1 Trypsin-like serine protease [Vibrio sp. B1FLJ16]
MRFNYVLLSGAFLMFPVATSASTDSSISKQDISAAIVGGETTTLNQLPFFARLILHKTGENQFANICGGSVVNDRFILTAAHCVQSDTFTDGWTTDDLRVLVKNPTMDDVYVSEFKDVSRIIIHPDYDESDLWLNDLALLELTYPITDNVQSITLPQDFGDYSNVSVYQIFGLGKTSTTTSSVPTIYAGQKWNHCRTMNVLPWFPDFTHRKAYVQLALRTGCIAGFVAEIPVALSPMSTMKACISKLVSSVMGHQSASLPLIQVYLPKYSITHPGLNNIPVPG